MLARVHARIINMLAPVVLGVHPNNTIFSFNYFTIRHVRDFMRRAIERTPAQPHMVVDVGSGGTPFFGLFAGRIARYVAIDVEDGVGAACPPAVEFMQGMAERLPLDDEKADIVVCNQVLST